MVALQIRDVSPGVRDALAGEARRRGQSLQAYLLSIVEAEVARQGNVDILDEVRRVGGGLTGGGTVPDVVELVRAQRDEREAELLARVRL